MEHKNETHDAIQNVKLRLRREWEPGNWLQASNPSWKRSEEWIK